MTVKNSWVVRGAQLEIGYLEAGKRWDAAEVCPRNDLYIFTSDLKGQRGQL